MLDFSWKWPLLLYTNTHLGYPLTTNEMFVCKLQTASLVYTTAVCKHYNVFVYITNCTDIPAAMLHYHYRFHTPPSSSITTTPPSSSTFTPAIPTPSKYKPVWHLLAREREGFLLPFLFATAAVSNQQTLIAGIAGGIGALWLLLCIAVILCTAITCSMCPIAEKETRYQVSTYDSSIAEWLFTAQRSQQHED